MGFILDNWYLLARPRTPLDVAGGVLQAGLGPARDVDGGPRLAQLQRDPSPDTTTRPRHQAHLRTCLDIYILQYISRPR